MVVGFQQFTRFRFHPIRDSWFSWLHSKWHDWDWVTAHIFAMLHHSNVEELGFWGAHAGFGLMDKCGGSSCHGEASRYRVWRHAAPACTCIIWICEWQERVFLFCSTGMVWMECHPKRCAHGGIGRSSWQDRRDEHPHHSRLRRLSSGPMRCDKSYHIAFMNFLNAINHKCFSVKCDHLKFSQTCYVISIHILRSRSKPPQCPVSA